MEHQIREDECPQCGAPLRDDGFCNKFCHEMPRYPIPHFPYIDDGQIGVSIGQPSTVPVWRIKLYQFEQEWREKSISEKDMWEEATKVMASLGISPSKDPLDISPQVITEWFLELMVEIEEVHVLEVEPTAWGISGEWRDPNSYLRVASGRWLAAGNLGITGVGLIMALLPFIHPMSAVVNVGLVGIPTAKAAFKSYQFIKGLTKVLIVMPEGSMERRVFEALYKLSRIPKIVNYDAERNRDFDRAFGFRPPSTREIMDEAKCEESEVRLVLAGLQQRGVVSYDRYEDAWRIKF